MKTFKQGEALLNLNEAINLIEALSPLTSRTESVLSVMAIDRMLAEDIVSKAALPEFRKSTMDGYALMQTPECGSIYRCIGTVQMGEVADYLLDLESCVYVPTGGMIPSNATTILPVEGAQINGNDMTVTDPKRCKEHWIIPGEDVTRGQVIFSKGCMLNPMALGMLSLLGIERVKVYRPIAVGILTMGDELVDSFEAQPLGKVRDVNQVVLKALVEKFGAVIGYSKRCPDDKAFVGLALKEALACCDLVITSGSSSMGPADFIPDLIETVADGGLLFHGLNIKPGKPVGLGLVGEKRVLALPGNPVSSAMTFVLVAEPLMASMLGLHLESNTVVGKLMVDCQTDGRETFIPVRLNQENGELLAYPYKGKSGLISQIATADGFFSIEAGKKALKNDKVVVRLFGKDSLRYVPVAYNPTAEGGYNE